MKYLPKSPTLSITKNIKTFIYIAGILLISAAFLVPYLRISSRKVVSKDISINISNLEDSAELQVLSIRSSKVITENEDDNISGAKAWAEFTGHGVFVIDLKQCEFLVDNARKIVEVRTPRVSIDHDTFTIDYNDTKILLFKNKYANDNYSEGVSIAQEQLAEAYKQIYDDIYLNPHFYRRAEESAEKIIASMVKSWNKDIDGLNVIVDVGVM